MANLEEKIELFKQQLSRITVTQLTFGLGGLSLIVMLIGTCSAYSLEDTLPPPLPPPPKPEKSAVQSYRYKEGYYRSIVDEDCEKYKVPAVGIEALKHPNAHRVEFTGMQTLRVGRGLKTKSLSLRALRRRVWIGEQGQGMKAAHLVLQISNRTDKHLAYIVKTRAADRKDQGAIAHNAMALAPGASILRTESLISATRSLVVEHVEVLELTPIGYAYVSRLDPVRLGYDPRTAQGHDFAELEPCRIIPWRIIRDGLASEKARWVDVIDFYSRHNCDEYSFFTGYRWSIDPLQKLPVKPPSA